MDGNPADFEAIGNRLGFRVAAEDAERFVLVWRGARFPAFLCFGVATALLFISVPIVEAIRQRGLEGPAASLWYFPVMNLILLGISVFLFSLKRLIVFDHKKQRVELQRQSIFGRTRLHLNYDELSAIRMGIDRVYSGFAVAGSSAAERFPVPSLRLVVKNGETVLLDRGSKRRLEPLAKHLGEVLGKPLQLAEEAPQ
ncbi:MAG: hypothetical protein HY695_27775 [Deltaproteobacteria bacterium]|nr:hypothetical protein [Deltaproteobacteria bacterium]